jgi:hypothetical protein
VPDEVAAASPPRHESGESSAPPGLAESVAERLRHVVAESIPKFARKEPEEQTVDASEDRHPNL